MAVYDINGNALSSVYDINGNALHYVYDIEGNEIFSGTTGVVDYSNYSFSQKWASKGIGSTQGFAIHDDKVFWVSKSGNDSIPANCYVWNLSDGSQALSSNPITIQSGHGNSISIAFPKLYASTAYAPPVVYVNNLTNAYVATLDKTLAINDGCVSLDTCIDETDSNILWTHGHGSNATSPNENFISKWDLTDLTDNGDGTYTPKLIQSVKTPKPTTFLPNSEFYLQGCCFHDGMLWYANGYSGTASQAYVVAVDPNSGEVMHIIDCETTAEPEGVQFYPDSEAVGGYAMYVGFQGMLLRKYTFGASTKYQGKSLSVLGDSISTYTGYIPSGNANFYTGSNCGVTSFDQTWWKRVIDKLGMTLNLNNSWSASRVSVTDASGGVTRASNLGTNPNVIIVYMGINDFNHEVATATFRSAYSTMLDTIKTTYPNAEVYCATLPPCERNGTTGDPEINDAGVYLSEWNQIITEVATAKSVSILDFANCGITYANMPTYMGDYSSSTGQALHPNADGHALIAEKAVRDLLK